MSGVVYIMQDPSITQPTEGDTVSAVVKVAGKLPGDLETNGLDDQVDDLVDSPHEIRVALVWYDVSKITDETDSGKRIPTVRVRRIEPLGSAVARYIETGSDPWAAKEN